VECKSPGERGLKELKAYSRHLENREIRTKRAYLADCRAFLNWCEQEEIDFLKLTEPEAEDWLVSLMGREVSLCRGTVNNKLNRVRSFYGFLLKGGRIPTNPFFYLHSLKTGRQLPRNILRPEEMQILLTSFPEMRPSDLLIKCLMELLYGCALRISEAESIRLEDLDLEERTLVITDHKNQKTRRVPLTESTAMVLRRYCRDTREDLLSVSALNAGFLFPQGGKTSLRCRLNRRLETQCKRLGLKVLTSHSFRHSAATHLLKNGAGIRQVQAFLGHNSIGSTQRYTHVEKEDLKSVLSSCHPREARHE